MDTHWMFISITVHLHGVWSIVFRVKNFVHQCSVAVVLFSRLGGKANNHKMSQWMCLVIWDDNVVKNLQHAWVSQNEISASPPLPHSLKKKGFSLALDTMHSNSAWSSGYCEDLGIDTEPSLIPTWTSLPGLSALLSWLYSCPCLSPSLYPVQVSSFPSLQPCPDHSVCCLCMDYH